MITQDSIQNLKARLDIVDVISNYIELKKSGANFKAPCPFHEEKTASFVVSPSKQIFHCFGCGKGGDSISFVMEHEKLSYPEAIEKLARDYNFTLTYTNTNKQNQTSLDVMQQIQKWFISLLPKSPQASQYLEQRGIYKSSIEKFGIGYAPSSNETLSHIQAQAINLKEALEVGIIGHDSGRYFARFIERITFPIYTQSGVLVGFGGRTISGHQAKYVNSPETKYFNKSRLLYAYHLARQSIYKTKEIIVTEGYMDAIMLHQAGFDNAVATLGTALTNEHLPLLKKGEPKVIVAYDGDKAGRAAALKASRLLSVSGFDGGVVLFEGGLDPADMVKNGDIQKLSDMFRKPKPFIEFVLDEIIFSYDLSNPKAKEKALKETSSYLIGLSALLQEEYKNYVAFKLGIDRSLIKIHTPARSNQEIIKKDTHKDMAELSLIKTILEKPNLGDTIIDTIDANFLQFHKNEFLLALEGKVDAPLIMAILVDENIKVIQTHDELKVALDNFMVRYYERELKNINFKTDITFEEKAFLIKQYRGKIMDIKRGIR